MPYKADSDSTAPTYFSFILQTYTKKRFHAIFCGVKNDAYKQLKGIKRIRCAVSTPYSFYFFLKPL